MASERGEHRHRHVALVATEPDAVGEVERTEVHSTASGISLLRLSVPGRLLMVAAAAALLWLAVAWALA